MPSGVRFQLLVSGSLVVTWHPLDARPRVEAIACSVTRAARDCKPAEVAADTSCENGSVAGTPPPPAPPIVAPTWRQRGALLLGRAAAQASRRLHRGGGTALPGVVSTALAPNVVELFSALGHGVVTVTGTNGKTTTSHLLTAAAERANLRPLTNRSGSNLERGLASTLVDAVDASGRLLEPASRLGVLEVDEAALPALWPRLRPRVGVFLNLFRDQLDRYGEIDSIAEGWRAMVASDPGSPTLVLNADDPSLQPLRVAARGPVVAFGIEDASVALPGAEHASDARFCACGSTFAYERVYVGHVGHWRCRGCGVARSTPEVAARSIVLREDGTDLELVTPEGTANVSLPLVGLYSVYNALAAAAAALAVGVPLEAVRETLEASAPAFGRQERITTYGREVRLLLAKNPAGLNAVIRTLLAGDERLRLLWLLNDGIQDGEDVSWIYDADFELLAGRDIEVVVSGSRAEDLALRLHLAGIEPAFVEAHTSTALEESLALVPRDGRLDVLATYTAMLELREMVAARAGAQHYWEAPR
ncbi:MAG: MurT ligase domain-containing protein [Dehalococcoidia bacterium]